MVSTVCGLADGLLVCKEAGDGSVLRLEITEQRYGKDILGLSFFAGLSLDCSSSRQSVDALHFFGRSIKPEWVVVPMLSVVARDSEQACSE